MSEMLRIETGPDAPTSLAVVIDGDASKPWLILSNSLAADVTMWEPQMAELTAHRRVVRYDTRGHGRSDAPKGPYDFDTLVGDIVAILDRLDIARADILGLSLGGMTALGLGLAHPDRVSKLICCDARGEFPQPAIAGWDQRATAVAAGGLESIVEETLARWFTHRTFRDAPGVVEHGRRMMLATTVEGYIGCVAALKTLDYRRRLPQLRRPTMFLVGEQDGAAPHAVVREMAEATPGAEFVLIPEAAHLANLEAIVEFNSAVRNFLLADDFHDEAVARL